MSGEAPGQAAEPVSVGAQLAAALDERDGAYRERARLVAFLAACYPSEITPAESDSGAWFLVFVTTPAGQMSWHLHEDDLDLFEPLLNAPETGIKWDGHTTEAKYERLADMTDRIARAGGFAGIVASMAKPERTEPYPTAVERDELRAERDQARNYATSLERITTAWARGMYSAWIDCRRGDAEAAARCLSEGIDGFDGTPWNGTETGTEWWERTKGEEGL